jgi:hypothetical protein
MARELQYINPTEWLHVTFGRMPPDGWGDPEWTEMNQSMWDDLDNSPFSGGARLFMRREGTVWKIDDIADSEHGTWRQSFEKSLAHK